MKYFLNSNQNMTANLYQRFPGLSFAKNQAMRNSYFGNSSLILLCTGALMLLLDVFDFFPFTRTLFLPMVGILGLIIGIVGFYERDKPRLRALLGMLGNGAMLGYWLLLLILRLAAIA